MNFENKKILVIEAHSDDSAIGASGLITHAISNGANVYCLLVACGDINFVHTGKEKISANTRINEYEEYLRYLGAKQTLPELWGYITDKESMLDTIPLKDIITPIENEIENINPHIILAQGPSFHQDHKRVYDAVIAALRPTQQYSNLESVLFFENPTYVHGETLPPNVYFAMNEAQMEAKLKMFRLCFKSQIRDSNNCLSPYGIKQWAKYRALEMGRPDMYAEAFHMWKQVIF